MFRGTVYLLLFTVAMTAPGVAGADCVVLLHGLARTAASMNPLEQAFTARGYRVSNVDYPSRAHAIERLAPLAVNQGIAACAMRDGERIHFVTHSLGGILVRYYLAHHALPQLGRVVMLAPPNNGSEVVDQIGDWPAFGWINGPAGRQLGTDREAVPARLGGVDYPVGIIAGNRSVNPLLSQLLPNPDDGKVSLSSTLLDGMTDFVVVPVSHPFIMRHPDVVRYAVRFIQSGSFGDADTTASDASEP